MPNEKSSKLRTFLRNMPQPDKVRMRKGDEEQMLALSNIQRQKWRMAEEACVAWEAEYVDCLDKNGDLIRTFTMPGVGEEPERSGAMTPQKGEYLTLRGAAELVDKIADRFNEAHEKGAESAARSQEQLVNLIEIIGLQLSAALTSNFNLATGMQNLIMGKDADAETGPTPSSLAMQALIGKLAERAMSVAADNPHANGAKKP